MSDTPQTNVSDYQAGEQTVVPSDNQSDVRQPLVPDAMSLEEVTRLAEEEHMRKRAARQERVEADPLAHLPQRHRDKVRAEMEAGRRRVSEHERAFAAMEERAEIEESKDGVHVSAEDILARQAAADRDALDRAASRRAAAIIANTRKQAADHNETYVMGRGGTSDEVRAVADGLVEQRLGQSARLMPAHVPGDGVEEARQANAAKEVADRVNSPGYYDDTKYQGVVGNVEVEHDVTSATNASLYDEGGNYMGPIEDDEQPGTQAAADPTAVYEAHAAAEAATDAPRPRRKPRPSPAEAVGQGPKSE